MIFKPTLRKRFAKAVGTPWLVVVRRQAVLHYSPRCAYGNFLVAVEQSVLG